MTELKLTLERIKRELEGKGTLVLHSDDPRLIEIGTLVADELGLQPPILTDRGDLGIVLERLRSEGLSPLTIIWTADMEEFGSDIGLRTLAEIPYQDPNAIFNAPTLSFLSRTGPFWKNIPDRTRAVYDHRYQSISEGYFEGLRRGGLEITSTPVKGDLGDYFRNGMADIGIVNDEDLLIETGTWPLDRIIPSRPVIAGLR